MIEKLGEANRLRPWIIGLASLVLLALGIAFRLHLGSLTAEYSALVPENARIKSAMADARVIVERRGWANVFFRKEVATDDAGFSLLIAGLWHITGDHSQAPIHTASLVLDCAAHLSLIVLTVRVFGLGAGLIAGLAYAFHIPQAAEIWSSNVFIYVGQFALIVTAIVAYPRRPGWTCSLLLATAGLLSFAATLLRGTFQYFPFLLAVLVVMRFGLKKGSIAAFVFLATFLGPLVLFKTVLGTPTHQMWHTVFVGLGEFPNGRGLYAVDTSGIEEVKAINPSINKWADMVPYMEILKGRSLSIIAENPWEYVESLVERAKRLTILPQDWFYLGLGATESQAYLASLIWVALSWCGLILALRKQCAGAGFFLVPLAYFSYSLLPMLSTLPQYFLAASLFQIPLAAGFVAGIGSARRGDEEAPWSFNPITWRNFLLLGAAGMAAVMGFVLVWIQAADSKSKEWKEEFLAGVSAYPLLEEKQLSDRPLDSRSSEPVWVSPPLEEDGDVFHHVEMTMTRGRAAIEVRDAHGVVQSPRVHSATLGRLDCFVGWKVRAGEAYSLYVWEDMPYDWPSYYEEKSGAKIEAGARHFQVQDFAKLEVYPDSEVTASASRFPNGHERQPFLYHKSIPVLRGRKSTPAYWAAARPAWIQIRFDEPRRAGRLILRHTDSLPSNPTVQLVGGPDSATQTVYVRPLSPEAIGLVGCTLPDAPIQGLKLIYDEPDRIPDPVYLRDAAVIESGEGRLHRVRLYKAPRIDHDHPYPTRLSFRSPESNSPEVRP